MIEKKNRLFSNRSIENDRSSIFDRNFYLQWNIAFDNILNEEVPPGVSIIAMPMIPRWLQQRKIFPCFSERWSLPLRLWTIGSSRSDWATQLQRWKRCCLHVIVGSVPSLLHKGGADKALYSPTVFGVVVWRKADFQGACQLDSSQSWLMSNLG